MLVLRLRYEEARKCTRVVYLPQLLDQNLVFIRESLTASVLGHYFAHIPFNREVALASPTDRRLLQSICVLFTAHHVTIVQAPNDILSMRMKLEEMKLPEHGAITKFEECLALHAEGNSSLQKFLSLAFVNLYDESDGILHHRRQLVYSIGKAENLSFLSQRVIAVQSLLAVLYWTRPGRLERLNKLLFDEDSPVAERSGGKEAGSFGTIRLLKSEHAHATWPKVQAVIVDSLMWMAQEQPTHLPAGISFIAGLPLPTIRQCLLDPRVAFDSIGLILPEDHIAVLLAIRGFLVYDTLASVLRQRPSVDFGSDIRRTKRVAVPYRASQQPAPRSEYADPDRVLLTTHLACYQEGLSQKAVEEAVVTLLSKNKVQQAVIYTRWFELGRAGFEDRYLELDTPVKIDSNNSIQMAMSCTRCIDSMRRQSTFSSRKLCCQLTPASSASGSQARLGT
jgi:hypothetical protein